MSVTTSIVVADGNEHTIEIYTGEDEEVGGNMSMYEKQTWKNGDIITEDKLNHMEEGISTGGGIYTYGEVPLFDGEVTTVLDDMPCAGGEITLQGKLPKTDIHVTFNGQDYTLPYGYIEGPGGHWGELADNAPSFTNYPVFVYEGGIFTSEAGTYALKIVRNSFELNDVIKNSFPKNILINVIEHSNSYSLDKTYSEIKSAVLNGDNVKFLLSGSYSTKEYYLDSISSNGGWLLKLFYVANDSTTELNILQFSYTNSEGYPSTSGSSPHN